MTAQTDRLNTALAGRYRIERHLGEGGMASVYLCEDLKHDRKVALKLLKPELAAVIGAERFVQEIKTTASLQHPHILPLFDSGTVDGFLFYVMPYIEGETLRGKLSRETQLGVDEAVRIAREVLDALEYAHQHGIVHRDVKPENILLHGGHAMVADFGIALAVSAAAGGRMTETGLSLGTPHYMSPEQATAEKEITARSDVYSLGSVLYEMLAGQPPHLGGSAQQIIMKIIAEPVQPVTTLRKAVPPNVAAAAGKALEKIPADRFESAKAFSEALVNPAYMHSGGAVAGATPGPSGPRTRTLARALVATSVLAAVLLGTTLWLGFRSGPPPPVSRHRLMLWGQSQIPQARVGRGLAISPDGGTVVFVDSSGAGWQLLAVERDRLVATTLAGTTEIAERGTPTFSPDGAWIAFLTRDGRLMKIPRGGGPAITIADSASVGQPAVAWLDGGTLLYVDTRFGLRGVSEDGGAPRQLVQAPAPSGDITVRAVVSVDGLPGGQAALLGMCSWYCQTGELSVLDLQSRKVTVLVRDGRAGWSLPGGLVAFVQADGGVFVAPFDGRRLAFTRPPTPVLDGVRTGWEVDMAVSASGTMIYVPGREVGGETATVQPVWVTRAGSASPIDTAWRMNFAGGNGKALSMSADGRHLAVTVTPPGVGAGSEIWIKQLDRGPFTKITFDGDSYDPAWTRDDRALLYPCGQQHVSLDVIFDTRLCRRRADGTGTTDTLLKLGHNIVDVLPTPDTSEFVLRVSAVPYREIDRGRLGDTAATPLLSAAAYDNTTPALSPDGRWLAYASKESGRFEVYVRPYPDVTAGRWQVSQAGGISPVWARNGHELYFRNGAKALVAVSVMPGAAFRFGAQAVLFDVSGYVGEEAAMYYDVAPDGRRFVFLRPVTPAGATGPSVPDKLIEVSNWPTEVQAKLAGKAPK